MGVFRKPIASTEEARRLLNNPYSRFDLFEISKTRGFLPTEDPIPTCEFVPFPFSPKLEMLAKNVPKYLAAGVMRQKIDEFSKLYADARINESYCLSQCTEAQKNALMRAVSFLAHAYLFGSPWENPTSRFPRGIARLLVALAREFNRHPILSYKSYALDNWTRIDENGPIAIHNIAIIQNFLGGADEDGFIAVHLEIEAEAGRNPYLVWNTMKELAGEKIPRVLLRNVSEITHALTRVNEVMKRMPERCNPFIYYERVRPYIHGSKYNPAFPNGIVYEGVEEFGGSGQYFYGETGAQSSIFPLLYAFFGIRFKDDMYLAYLHEMREYMPENHREYIVWIEVLENAGISVIDHARRTEDKELLAQCKQALEQMTEFLKTHFGYAQSYIERQHQKNVANPTSVGTGGSMFIKFLYEHIRHLEKFNASLV